MGTGGMWPAWQTAAVGTAWGPMKRQEKEADSVRRSRIVAESGENREPFRMRELTEFREWLRTYDARPRRVPRSAAVAK